MGWEEGEMRKGSRIDESRVADCRIEWDPLTCSEVAHARLLISYSFTYQGSF